MLGKGFVSSGEGGYLCQKLKESPYDNVTYVVQFSFLFYFIVLVYDINLKKKIKMCVCVCEMEERHCKEITV